MTGFSRILTLFKQYPAITGLTIALLLCMLKISAQYRDIADLERKVGQLYTAETAADMCSESVSEIRNQCKAVVDEAVKRIKNQPAPPKPAKSAEEFNKWLKEL